MKLLALLVLVGVLLIACLSYNTTHVHSSFPVASSSVSPRVTVSTSSPHPLDYRLVAQQAAQAAGILVWVFVRQINEESGFNPHALSSAGAEGIAQFMPGTARGLKVNPWNPIASLYAAARLMASYVSAYVGDYAKALAAYNAGPAMVAYAIAQGGVSWRLWLPRETRTYITIILFQSSTGWIQFSTLKGDIA